MSRLESSREQKLRTICEVHREMYDIIHKHLPDNKVKEELVEKLEDAYLMAKKMNGKLRQYKYNYDDGWWEKESDEIKKSKHELRSQRPTKKKKGM